MKKFIFCYLISLFSISVCAAGTDEYRPANEGFFDRKAEWWFWYKDPSLMEDLAEKPPSPPKPEPSKEKPKENPVEPKPGIVVRGEKNGPPILSTAWLSKNLTSYRQSAMDDPTEENVSLYWWLERVAKDKADRFTQISKKVFYKDHLLNEDSRRPWSDAGQRMFDKRRKQAAKKLMDKMSDEFGLFYFFESDCGECKDIEPVIKSLEMRYGFKVIAISMDGKPIKGGHFENAYKPDAGHSKRLGVKRVPSVFIAKPPNSFVKIAEGFMPMTELGNVMMLLAEDQGWISKEEYAETLPVNNLLVDPTLELSPETEMTPAEMISLIRKNVKRY